MNSNVISLKSIALIDFVILSIVYLLPSIAHIVPIPVYYLDPMRLLVLLGYLIGSNQINAYFLAATVPLFSMLVTGHPSSIKSILISIELISNLYFYITISKRFNVSIFLSIFTSIVLSKIVYYLLKYASININLMDGTLISTSIYIQLCIAVFISLLFYISSKFLSNRGS